MTDLARFLMLNAGRRRERGVWDCAAAPAAWIMHCGKPDPIADIRETYDDRDAADIVPLFEAAMDGVGIRPRVGPPQPGDVGVVRMMGLEMGSIFSGERWMFIGERGFGFARIASEHVVAAWAVDRG